MQESRQLPKAGLNISAREYFLRYNFLIEQSILWLTIPIKVNLLCPACDWHFSMQQELLKKSLYRWPTGRKLSLCTVGQFCPHQVRQYFFWWDVVPVSHLLNWWVLLRRHADVKIEGVFELGVFGWMPFQGQPLMLPWEEEPIHSGYLLC